MPPVCVLRGGLGLQTGLTLPASRHSPCLQDAALVMALDSVELVESAWVALGEKTVHT